MEAASETLCAWNQDSFTATAVYTGENRLIRVVGSGTCPMGGYTVVLEPDNPGINPDPTVLPLRLSEQTPEEVGTTGLTDHELDEVFEVSQQVSKVSIRTLRLQIEVSEPD